MDQQKENKKITEKDELIGIIKDSFQTNQEYMDRRFDKVENRLEKVEKKLDGFIDTFNEEKLPMRVEYIENVLDIPKK